MDRPNSAPSTAAGRIPPDGPSLGLFEATPNPYLLLAPDSPAYTIVGVNEAYLRATMTERQAIMGRSIFEVFPDDPGAPEAFSVRDLRASFDRVLKSAQADRLPVHQHNIRRPDGTFEERHWRPFQVPVLGPGGEIVSLIHYAEDVTRSVLDARVARTALVASEARFRTITETIEAAFAIVEVKFDADDRPIDYRFLEANPAFERQAGIDLRGKWVTEFAPNLERFWFETYGLVALTGEPATFENYAEAFKRWFDVRAVRVGKPEEHQIAIFFSDVTARRQLQARNLATLQLTDRLRDVTEPREVAAIAAQVLGETLQASLVGYGRVDTETATVTVEQNWSATHVRSLPSLIRSRDYGSHFDDLLRGETVAIADVLLDFRTSASTDKLKAIGARAFVNVPVIEQGRLVALLHVGQSEPRTWTDDELIFIRDVTERVRVASERAQREKDLRASEALARANIERVQLALAAGAIIGTWFWDLPTDRFTVDEAFARAFGLDPTLGRDGIPLAQIVATVHPEDQAGLAAAIDEAIARGGAYAHQYRTRRADGNYYWLEANGHVTHALDGTPQSFPGVLIDIEERRAIEAERERATALLRSLTETLEQRVTERTAELMRAEEQLRQSQKMEAVGQLTGGLAHDFNNLLAGIVGSLDLLQRRVKQGRTADIDRYVTGAMTAANRAAALTHRLLAFSRRQTLDPKVVDANALVAGMEELLRRTVGPSIAVETTLPAGVGPILCDPNQLENVLLNLSINARDAMPNGGSLRIETRQVEVDALFARERDMPEGAYVTLAVTDTGTGMPPDVIARAFDPFFTTKPLGEGTGLGLSMIYGFAKQSGGQVRIHSKEGIGTTVTVYLPRYAGAVVARPLEEIAGAVGAGTGETVLVVDDEPLVRGLVVEVLQELGYGAIQAVDGVSALREIERHPRFDLLVTDVAMPGGMNGRQLADVARQRHPGLGVLFITGFAESIAAGNGALGPGMQVLTKPFTMEALALRIREMIDGGARRWAPKQGG